LNIRTRLRALILATLLPVALFGVAGAWVLVERERATFERAMREQARALMMAVDTEVRASIAALEILARAPALERGDLAAFRAEAARALAARRPDWVNVLVSHPGTGQMLMNLLLEPGAEPGAAPDPDTIIEAARSGLPVLSRVALSPSAERLAFGVRVPVMREGRAVYVISALVDTAVVARVVDGQSFPSGWALAVIDGNHRFVVRRPAPAGGSELASESLKQALAKAAEGFERGRLLDGSEIYRAYRRSSIGAWSASVAAPRAAVEAGLRGVWLLIAGFIGATALGLWIAWWLAARISRPIAALAAAAPALGRGEVTALPPPGPLGEVRELSRALGEAARAVREREEQQRRAEQALRAADRAKDEFLAMLGHELRNPLASVSNAAQLLRIAGRQPDVLDKVSAILSRQAEHMTRLVDDLLEVGRVTGGKVRLERAPLDLGSLAGEVVRTWEAGGRFRLHRLEQSLEAVWVSADRARIEQIISNLLDNALKYTPAAGEIRLSVRGRDGIALLEVADTGEGMPAELVGRVFDLFVQGDRSLARQPGGLGIGLTMAKRLAELHGGSIRAQSDGPGRGATFSVELPAIERPAAEATPRAQPAAGGKARILVVEDNEDARESLTELLRFSGHEVLAVADGARGLEAATARAFDVALVDVGLPGLDGYEVARRLKADPATRSLRLVALTGYGSAEDRGRALAAGFDEHLAKPVELQALEALLRPPAAG
jgi:signal transduction histidine kinase